MDAKNLRKIAVLAIALVCISAGHVWADKLALQEKLSKDVQIQLRDVTIAEALNEIGQKAGVKIVLSDEAAWKLPQGQATRLSVMLDGALAESLTEMLNAFFMRYAVGEKEITIYPRPELEHILGRPTTKQLKLLNAIYTKPIGIYYLDEEQRSINEALGIWVLISPIQVQGQLNNLLRQLVGKDSIYREEHNRGRTLKYLVKEPREPEPNEPEPTEYRLPTPVTLVQLLSQVVPRDTRWYISGMDFPSQIPEIRIVDSGTFGWLKLNQKVDVLYKDVGLDKILQDLANRAGTKLIVHPGSYLGEHKSSVTMQNITIEQAIRNIADIFGAACGVSSSKIEFQGPGKPEGRREEPAKSKRRGKATDDDYVGKISIPMEGGKYYIEFMLREQDLTDELRKLWQEKMKAIIKGPQFIDLTPEQESSESADKRQKMTEVR